MQMSAHTSPRLPVKHNTSFICFFHKTTVDFCGYTLSTSLTSTTVWYSIYPLSFFRLENLRCLHEMYCKSVRNLRPPHAPVVAICPVSLTIICFSVPQPPSPPQKKMRNDICIQTDTHRDKHLLQAVYRGGCNWLAPSIHTTPEM